MSTQAEWSAVRAKLAFTCAHEADHLPPLDPQADALFKYALFLEKKLGPKDYDAAARYYRIAAAHGHYKANHNLQLLVSTGQASSPHAATETIDLAEQLIAAGIPGGYYDMGHYLELGYGVKQDERKARIYFRKAADLGSPEGQYYVGDLLSPKDRAPDISRQMLECATDQGYGKAANYLGIDFSTNNLYPEAVVAFQKGVKAGDTQSALALQEGFSGPPSSNKLFFLALTQDPERSRRYELIGRFIDDNDGLNPKVPDIDRIVPLPPAKLPEWDGTFQWQKEQDAAQPLQKPADALVTKLAREKNLDPVTGLPLAPIRSAEAERVPLGTLVSPGNVCPQDGVWCVQPFDIRNPEATRRFTKGETIPTLGLNDPRIIPGLDWLLGMRTHKTNMAWTLKAYVDQA
ncbi:SEL1-like repeat protein [Paraburkholderia sp. GAS82]|uniref:SEL1-like repeat protein n=1 Tax=Paraburkholderia sp. GAS82 TaxID=3035137 RepID=UPI003D208FB9